MLTLVIALGMALLIYSIILLLFSNSPKERVKSRVNKLVERAELEHVHEAVLKEKKTKRKTEKKTQLISKRFEDHLAASGIQLSAREYILLWGGLTLLPGLAALILGLQVLAVIGICIVGFAIPPFMVKRARGKRQQVFNKQLGESLTIMSNCMRSGYSFQQAMGSIAKEMQPPISLEFGRVVREMNYGATMEQALNNMVARVRNKDLELLVSAVITSTQVGANLSEILDTIAETVSDRIRIREEVRVCSAQGRMSGIIIGLLPVAVILFLMIVNPSYFGDFASHPVGRIMIIVSVCLEITGFIVINKIVDIKY